MASPERAETRQVSATDFAMFKGLFRGEVHHVNYEVTDFPTRS
jgi:hypothetical protein